MMDAVLAAIALVLLLLGAALCGYAMAKGRACPAALGAALVTTGVVLLGIIAKGP